MADNNSSSRIFLIGAVILGVLATVMAFLFIQSSAGQDRGPKVRIVVAARDLKPNAAIDPERDLKVEEIPLTFASLASQSLDSSALANYKGQRLNRRILASQPVFLADLAAGGSLDIKEPYRALTIPADAGLVIPGDYVQILVSSPQASPGMTAPPAGATSPPPDAATPPTAPAPAPPRSFNLNTATLVSGGRAYRVLAVGGSMARTRSQATNADQFESNAGSKLITLEVTPDQARDIVSSISTSSQRNMLLICPPNAGTSPTTAP